MTRTTAILFAIWLAFLLLSTLFCLYTTAGLLHNITLLQHYTPPTQEPQLRQDILLDLQERMDAVEEIFGQVREYEVTAYTLQCGNGDGYTATMTRPTVGRTIAVDPQVIPYGSRVWLEDIGWRVAEDCGGAIRGHRIDLYVGESKADALAWGKRKVRGVVL